MFVRGELEQEGVPGGVEGGGERLAGWQTGFVLDGHVPQPHLSLVDERLIPLFGKRDFLERPHLPLFSLTA